MIGLKDRIFCKNNDWFGPWFAEFIFYYLNDIVHFKLHWNQEFGVIYLLGRDYSRRMDETNKVFPVCYYFSVCSHFNDNGYFLRVLELWLCEPFLTLNKRVLLLKGYIIRSLCFLLRFCCCQIYWHPPGSLRTLKLQWFRVDLLWFVHLLFHVFSLI